MAVQPNLRSIRQLVDRYCISIILHKLLPVSLFDYFHSMAAVEEQFGRTGDNRYTARIRTGAEHTNEWPNRYQIRRMTDAEEV